MRACSFNSVRGHRQDFHGGVSKEARALHARAKIKSHAHFDHAYQILCTSDDVLTSLQRKRSKNNASFRGQGGGGILGNGEPPCLHPAVLLSMLEDGRCQSLRVCA